LCHNINGNFPGQIELMTKFDTLMKEYARDIINNENSHH
jgi:hypothetical protein